MEESQVVVGRIAEGFQGVSVGGKQGTFFLTSRALAFVAQSQNDGHAGEEAGQVAQQHDAVFELHLFVWFQQWTSTERSKKSAKARLTFSNASALPSSAVGLPVASTAVLDFGADRGKMDAACNLLQQLHAAERQRHPRQLPLQLVAFPARELQAFLDELKLALELPTASSLRLTPSLSYLLLPPSSVSAGEWEPLSPLLAAPACQESERAPAPPTGGAPASTPGSVRTPAALPPGADVRTPGGEGASQLQGSAHAAKRPLPSAGRAVDEEGTTGSEAKRVRVTPSGAAPDLPKTTRPREPPAAASAPVSAAPSAPRGRSASSPAAEAPGPSRRLNLQALERLESLREARERRAAQRSLLAKNAVLRSLYLFLVGDPEEDEQPDLTGGDSGSLESKGDDDATAREGRRADAAQRSGAGGAGKHGRTARAPGKVLSPEEFWKLHETDLVAHRMQLAPDPPASAFLIRPPQFEYVGSSGTEKPASLVDCTEQMLDAILKEDPRISEVYRQLVAAGRMTREKFFERLFQSKYFQEFLGLPARQGAASSAAFESLSGDDSGALINLSNAAPPLLAPSPQDVLDLVTPSEDLISTEAFRLRGFGIADGLNSFSGDLVDSLDAKMSASSPSSAEIQTDAAAAGLPGLPSVRRPLQSRLLERFNRQSHRLLLQQMLPPTAVAAASQVPPGPGAVGASATAGEIEKLHEQLQLLAEQEKQLVSAEQQTKKGQRGHAEGAAVSGRQRLASGSASEKAYRLLEDLQLSDLEAPQPVQHQRLEVSRRHLYAAGSRAPSAAAEKGSAPAAAASGGAKKPEAAPDGGTGGEDGQVPVKAKKETEGRGQRHDDEENRRLAQAWIANDAPKTEGRTITPDAALYENGRYMFVFNTKLCQSEKMAHVATLDYEPVTVNAVRAHQARVTELLQHFYASAVPDEEKRARIIQALDATKNELERTQESTFGPYTGAATKALCMPLFDQINAAKLHHSKLKKMLSDLRAQRKAHHMRHAAATHAQSASAQPNAARPALTATN